MTNTIPYRQIRATYDDHTITVYQAYSAEIANAAVHAQKLNASTKFSTDRMTWIKPSWNWMMYRSGYSYKDARQTHVLAIKMTRGNFLNLLSQARLAHESNKSQTKNADASVIVQWDPERGPRLEKLEYRSLQIGIPRQLSELWVDEWIESIEDVTLRARDLKRTIDDGDGTEDLVQLGLLPLERPFDVPVEIEKRLGMLPESSEDKKGGPTFQDDMRR